MFGYPTGIGCLLIKKTKFNKLKKRSFAGGTVSLSAVNYSGHFLKPDHERFENGTVNYLNIPAITTGLNFITAAGIDNINNRIKDLSRLFLTNLPKLLHDTGMPVIKLYGPANTANRGGTFLINFFDADELVYPLQHVEKLAAENKISLRTGCFCNPGIDELNNWISAEELKKFFREREYGDYDDMIEFTGKMRGAVRISFGLATTTTDIVKFMHFAKSLLNKSISEAGLRVLDCSMPVPFG